MTDNSAQRRHRGMPVGMRRTVLRGLALLLVLPLFRSPAESTRRLVREGLLVEISLFPVELGGPDDQRNTSYITPEAAFVREMVIGTFSRFLEDDTIDQVRIVPEYKGASIVPSRIAMEASHSGQGGSIGTTIEVW